MSISVAPYGLSNLLEVENIEVRPVWKPLHLQPLFEGCKFYPHANDVVASERLFAHGVCLPSGSNMAVEQQDKVIALLKRALME